MSAPDPRVRLVQVTAAEALTLQLGEVAILAAAELLREGGYRPTPEQFERIAKETSREVLACVPLVATTMPELSDEQLLEAAVVTGRAAVREVLGPPPMAH